MSFIWDMPTRLIFGAGAMAELEKETMPGKKAMIITSKDFASKESGGLEKVTAILELKSCNYDIWSEVVSNPEEELVEKGIEACKIAEADFVIGLGGGSVIATSKAIAGFSLPYIAVPTTPASGAEVTDTALLRSEQSKELVTLKTDFPKIAVVDPELMLTLSEEDTKLAGITALFNALQAYMSNKRGEAGQMVELAAIGNIVQFLNYSATNPDDIEGRSRVAYAATMAGMGVTFGSLTSLSAIAATMSAKYPKLPMALASLMIAVEYFRYFIDNNACEASFLEMAMAMGQHTLQEPMDFLRALKRVLGEIGIDDVKMSDYDIKEEDLEDIAKASLKHIDFFENDPIELDEASLVEILEGAYM